MNLLYAFLALVPAIFARTHVREHQYVPMPRYQLGIYVLLADHTEEGFENNATKWTPALYPWQQEAANVLYFTFIIPDEEMAVPMAYQKLAKTRGTNEEGAVPADTVILFAIGGYLNSLHPNPWPWLTTQEAAEKMAEKVAQWPDLYGCDGIDLDLEEGAGNPPEAGPNMIHFVRKLKELNPKMYVNQPVYGFPNVPAENDVVNESWDKEGNPTGMAQSIGIMAYSGTSSLNYVGNYANVKKPWENYPISVPVPMESILVGCKGKSTSTTITKLAHESVSRGLFGVMVWYSSVVNGFQYATAYDANTSQDAIDGYIQARKILDAAMT